MKRFLLALLLVLGVAKGAQAQITVPNSFVVFTHLTAAAMNGNFTAVSAAVNRNAGGTITGTINVSDGVTIDGADLSAYMAGGKLSALSSAADAVKVGGGITAAGVAVVDATGKIPALSSTYFASLNASVLTSLSAANLSGTISSATQDLITRTGTVVSGTWSALFGNVSGANLTSLNGSNFGSGTVPTARLGSGSADSSVVLRGDSTWASVAGGSMPTDMIIFSASGTCQTGFVEFTEARGYAIVGLPASGTNKGTVGSGFSNLESRTHSHSVPGLSIPGLGHPVAFASMSLAGGHNHSFTTSGPSSTNIYEDFAPSFNWASTTHTHTSTTSSVGDHNHGGSLNGGTSGSGTSGTASVTNVANYIQLIACRKT